MPPNSVAMTAPMSSGAPIESDHGNDARHEPGLVQQGTEQQCVDARHEALSELERPVGAFGI